MRWGCLAWIVVALAWVAVLLWLRDGWQCEVLELGTWEEGTWCRRS